MFNHPPNTLQLFVQASGYLGEACLPSQTTVKYNMYQIIV